jgi:hypothetical protein
MLLVGDIEPLERFSKLALDIFLVRVKVHTRHYPLRKSFERNSPYFHPYLRSWSPVQSHKFPERPINWYIIGYSMVNLLIQSFDRYK